MKVLLNSDNGTTHTYIVQLSVSTIQNLVCSHQKKNPNSTIVTKLTPAGTVLGFTSQNELQQYCLLSDQFSSLAAEDEEERKLI